MFKTYHFLIAINSIDDISAIGEICEIIGVNFPNSLSLFIDKSQRITFWSIEVLTNRFSSMNRIPVKKIINKMYNCAM